MSVGIRTIAAAIACAALLASKAQADSVTAKAADNSVAAEQASFEVHEDFEVNLFADESMGIANPIAMHWDTRGRLWLLTTMAYAQLTPGESADDKLFILEDTDSDGRADQIKTFADGLNMPIGFALGDGGVWIGEGDKLLFLPDRDGDDVADGREVVLRGFGIGDTHQNISNFTWGPDGCLYFSQGLHTYSRVETPWGIVRGDTAGFFRFDPREHRLEPFCFPSMASQNPCGIAFDKRGAMFLKSNNKELIFVTAGLVPTTHPRSLVPIASIGATPGKSMGGEYVESAHLPDWLQNHILIAGYYSHRVTAFPLVEDGAGFARVEPVQLMVAEHSSFRPVDIRIGPDGAIFVADWFNPIIGHYQASLRHPDRDKQHGRIWRMTAKGRPPLKEMPPQLKREAWQVSEQYTQKQRRLLEADFADLEPFERLQKVIALANRKEPDSLRRAMHALDHQPDRFIDYALRQAVHAQAEIWEGTIELVGTKGSIGDAERLRVVKVPDFDRQEHLAFVLEERGMADSAAFAKRVLNRGGLAPALQQRFSMILARFGGPEDLRDIFQTEGGPSAALLKGLAEASQTRKMWIEEDTEGLLGRIVKTGKGEQKLAAIRLAGLWKVSGAYIHQAIEALAFQEQHEIQVRAAALVAYARIGGKNSAARLARLAGDPKASMKLRVAAVQALVLVSTERAAERAVSIMKVSEDTAVIAELLGFFGKRKDGLASLAEALATGGIDSAAAQRISQGMSSFGLNDLRLTEVVNSAMGIAEGGLKYDPGRVLEVVKAVRESGDPQAGKKVFERAELTCVACHQLGGEGGLLGPSLDTVGAGLPLDLIVESVLWPQRQLKEGYFALGVTTKDGTVHTGYQESQQTGVLRLKDPASTAVQSIPVGQITERKNLGSLMPAGLTASLKPEELRDLIAYLASLKG